MKDSFRQKLQWAAPAIGGFLVVMMVAVVLWVIANPPTSPVSGGGTQRWLPFLAFLLLIGVGFCISVAAYFLPAIIAASREHPSANAIAALNLFLGWTFIGWVIALVWSLADNR